jgi:hypothetical protein
VADSLSRKQRQLKNELLAISETLGLDYWNILGRKREARTPVLEVIKREVVRGEVVSQYTLIDDLLATELCRYFFPNQDLLRLWKTKRFRRFNYYVIERLYLLHKLALIKDVYAVPNRIAATIEEINALRNAMAHAFFPENLRVYQMKGRTAPRKPIIVRYKGEDIFTVQGTKKFKDDCVEVAEFLALKMKRRKNPAKIVRPPEVTDSTPI